METQVFPKKSHAQIHSLAGIHPGLRRRDGGLGSPRHIQGETELCGCRARAGGADAIVPVLSPPPT